MTTCAACGLPVHRYSPNHKGSGTDLMGCVNSLLGVLDRADDLADYLSRTRSAEALALAAKYHKARGRK